MEAREKVLVVGATGGVGQLVVAKLLAKDYTVRILTRDRDKAHKLFGEEVEIVVGDIRELQTLTRATQSLDYLICAVGTTAFPSSKWELKLTNFQDYLAYLNPQELGKKAANSPWQVDAQGVINLISSCDRNLRRFVLVSSCGVLSQQQFPFTILNLFGVLAAKKQGEDYLINSQIPYTIIRPSRLIDGPYTSYDLNTLLQAKTNGEKGIVIASTDKLNGESSRIDVANACVECLSSEQTVNQAFAIINQGARQNPLDWRQIWQKLSSQ